MSNLDEQVILILDKIQDKQNELEIEEKIYDNKKWKTNGNVNTPSFSNKKIQVMDENEILNFTAFLISNEEYQQKAAKFLDHSFNIKFNNYSYEDWFEDCKKRLNIILIKEKIKKFKELKKSAEELQSDDLKRQKALDKILEELQNFN